MLPVVFAAILVYLDTAWIAIIVPILFFVYFCVQLFYVRAKTSSSDYFVFAIFMMVGYNKVLLFFTKDPMPLNYAGWVFTTLLTTLVSFNSIKYLRRMAKTIKILCIGKQRH